VRALRRLKKLSKEVVQDIAGGVLIYTALATPVMIGFTGLAVDAGVWYAGKRNVQSVADSASVAGALELVRSGESGVNSAAVQDATTNGYDSAGGDTIDIYNPPISGPLAGDTSAVEVVVRRPAPVFFARLLIDKADTIAGRAVAVSGDNSQTCL
jgi:uncharacterized membrane protein